MVMHLISCISFDSYIKPQRRTVCPTKCSGCISFDSYIKPQPKGQKSCEMACCISFDSYIKPRPCAWSWWFFRVVYLLIPTSNHNIQVYDKERNLVVYLLIPTSNHNSYFTRTAPLELYIF